MASSHSSRAPGRAHANRRIAQPLTSKLVCIALLTCAALYNCRTPNNLDASAGDRRADAYVGDHLTAGLVAQAGIVLLVAAAYCLAPGSSARWPWTTAEIGAAAACLVGTALRAWCFSTLGRLFTYEVGIRRGHELIGEGPYALLVHPSYTGATLVGLGYSCYSGVMRRWPTALVITVMVASALALRIANEERVLADHFGEAWRQHTATRWRLVPLLF